MFDIPKPADGSGLVGHLLDLGEMLSNPVRKIPGLSRVVENKYRGALHGVIHDCGRYSAAFMHEFHAAVIAGHEGTFSGGHGHVKFSLGMFAIHQQRPGNSDRHLGHTDKAFDIALEHGRVEGMAADMIHSHAGFFLDKVVAGNDRLRCVVIFRARNLVFHILTPLTFIHYRARLVFRQYCKNPGSLPKRLFFHLP